MYSFTDIWRSFESMFITLLMANFPDILIDSYDVSSAYTLFFMIFILLNSIIIFGFLVGAFYFHYNSFYIENLSKIEAEHPFFKEEIAPLVEAKFLNAD